MKVSAILNPRAGVAAHRALRALERRRHAWGELTVFATEAPGHARELAARAVDSGCEIVLAAGGDGTANEVAESLLGSATTFGLVPVGSGNGLARTLGIPLRPEAALCQLEKGVVRSMDVGLINEKPFLNVAGAGFDAEVGEAFAAHGRRGGRRGVLSYVRLSVAAVRSDRARTFVVEANGERHTCRAMIVAFFNGRQYGGGAVVAPRAVLDDGRLECVIFGAASFGETLLAAPRLFLGGIERYRHYRLIEARHFVVEGHAPFHRDGEPAGAADRLEVRLLPRALRVLAPRKTAEARGGPFQKERGA